jgi:hypothetical protein
MKEVLFRQNSQLFLIKFIPASLLGASGGYF